MRRSSPHNRAFANRLFEYQPDPRLENSSDHNAMLMWVKIDWKQGKVRAFEGRPKGFMRRRGIVRGKSVELTARTS